MIHQSQAEALYVKLLVLTSMIDRLQLVQKREAINNANDLLSLLDRMKGEETLMPDAAVPIEPHKIIHSKRKYISKITI